MNKSLCGVHGRMPRLAIAILFLIVSNVCLRGQNIDFKINGTVRQAIEALNQKENLSIIVNTDEVDLNRRVSIDVRNSSVTDVLNRIFSGQDVDYVISGNRITINKKSVEARQSQQLVLKGKIVDADGEPLIGASAAVRVGAKLYGDIADRNGNFQVTLPSNIKGTEHLVVSFMGFIDEDIVIGNRTWFEITMKDDTEMLEEAVAVGYGTQKKINLTGAVSAVSSEDLKERHATALGKALQGMIPNLNITVRGDISPFKDGFVNYNIRGNGSPNGGSPLILVDGVETNLSRINMNDVESISVLKDAASAAIYGARASFGVILVTTKSGKNDTAPKLTFDASYSTSKSTVKTDFITNGYESALIADTFRKGQNGRPFTNFTEADYQMLYERRNDVTENPERPWVITDTRNGRLEYVYLGNFDWYNWYFDERRPTQEYNLNVSGGGKTVNYNISGRYINEKGIFRQTPDVFDGYYANAKIGVNIRPWLKLTSNTRFYRGSYLVGTENTDAIWTNTHAFLVPVHPDGTTVSHTSATNSTSQYIMSGWNSIIQKNKRKDLKTMHEISQQYVLKATITDHLSANADFSYKFNHQLQTTRTTEAPYYKYPGVIAWEPTTVTRDKYDEIRNERINLATNGYLFYENSWNNAHNFTATAGVNYESLRYKALNVRKKELLSEDLSDFNLATGSVETLKGGLNEAAIAGYFYRLTYNYKSRYLFEVDGRYDGSSRFLRGKRWGFFPSASVAYRISEEPFWKSLSNTINNAKIRASYGSLGNQDISYYEYFQTISASGTIQYSFDGEERLPHAYVSDPVSTGTWEKVYTKDIGLDLAFLDNRLTFTGDMYIRDVKGILSEGKQLPSIYGADEPTVNSNDLRTKGWEIEFGWKDSFMLGGKRFGYNITGSLADYTAKYTRCDNPSGLYGEPYVGKQLGEIWGFQTDGKFKTDAEAAEWMEKYDMRQMCADYYLASSSYGYGAKAGDLKYIDLNGDGKITNGARTIDDPGDRKVIGNSQPRYSFGLRLAADYGGFDFSIFFQGIGKQQKYPGSGDYRFWGPYNSPRVSFIPKNFLDDVWSEDNPNGYFPRARGSIAVEGSLYGNNTDYLQNAAYIRLKSLTLGYTLPKRIINKVGIANLRIYLSGENLWYASPLHTKYIDPELFMLGNSGYFFPKTLTFGATIDL